MEVMGIAKRGESLAQRPFQRFGRVEPGRVMLLEVGEDCRQARAGRVPQCPGDHPSERTHELGDELQGSAARHAVHVAGAEVEGGVEVLAQHPVRVRGTCAVGEERGRNGAGAGTDEAIEVPMKRCLRQRFLERREHADLEEEPGDPPAGEDQRGLPPDVHQSSRRR
jgi:hypothetical protein